MKTNAFGDPVIQPGDDIFATWNDRFMPEAEPQLTARFVENDQNFGWSATLADENGMEMEVHDFESEDALLTFLRLQGVEVEAD